MGGWSVECVQLKGGKEGMYKHSTFQTFPGLGVAIRDSKYMRQRGSVAWLVQLHSQAGKKGKIKQMALSEDCDLRY